MPDNDEKEIDQVASPDQPGDSQEQTAPPAEPAPSQEPSFAEKFFKEHPHLLEDDKPPKENASEVPKADDQKAPEKVEVTPKVPESKNENPDADPPELDRKDPRFAKVGKRLDEQRAELKELRPVGQFGKAIIEVAQKQGLAPDVLADLSMATIAAIGEGSKGLSPTAFKQWVQLGVRANAGDPAAVQELAQVLLNDLKWTPPNPNARAEEIYKEIFEADVKALTIDEDVARSKAKMLADKERATIQKPVAPVPQVPQAPVVSREQVLEQAVSDNLSRIENALLQSPNGAELHAEVIKRIEALDTFVPELERVAKFNEILREVQRERTQPVRTPPASTGIRNRGVQPVSGKPGTWEAERARIASMM